MAKFLKFLLLLVAVTAVVWLASLWHWHSRGLDPSEAELAIYLLALPLMLTLSLVACVWQIQKLRAFASAPLMAPTAAPSPPPAPAQKLPEMLVLYAQAHSRLGLSWEDAQKAIQAGEHPPALHAHFLDGAGKPAFTAQWNDLSLDDVATAWETFITDNAQSELALAGLATLPDDILRALALLSNGLIALQPGLNAQWPVLVPTTLDRHKQGPGAAPASLPRVRIQIGIPARWPEPWRLAVTAWVQQQLSFSIMNGLKAAGQSAAMAQTPQAAIKCSVHTVEDASAFLAELTACQERWLTDGVPALMVVAVADSFLSQACIARRHAQGQLPGINASQGRVPGEAGATLMLATPQWVAAAGYPGTPPLATTGAPHMIQREHATPHKGKVPTSDALAQAVESALQASELAPERVGSVTTDTDQRPQQQAEMLSVVDKHFAHLEASTDVLCAGVGAGDLGIAQWAVSVALATDQVHRSQAPALVLGHADEWQRMAWVLNTPTPNNDVS